MLGNRNVYQPVASELFANVRPSFIDLASFPNLAMFADSPRRFHQLFYTWQLAAERALATNSHAKEIFIAPAAITMLSPDLHPMFAVTVP